MMTEEEEVRESKRERERERDVFAYHHLLNDEETRYPCVLHIVL
jgi:hypothetical protein